MPALLSPPPETRRPEAEDGAFTFSLPDAYPRESDFARACRPECANWVEEAIVRVMFRHGLGGGVIV